jgi:hypothetical protein
MSTKLVFAVVYDQQEALENFTLAKGELFDFESV